MGERSMLEKVAAIHEKYDFIRQQTGGYYNIFAITNIGQNELLVCKILHDLLNPKGFHYQGDLYLRLFVEHVLRLPFTEQDFQQVQVFREYRIKNDRRIDLFIKTPRFEIPIEVKIHAGDQSLQCADYYQHAKLSKLVYLTKYGDAPSKKSTDKLSEDAIHCLSFQEDILSWLELCMQQPQTIKIASICEVLLQFMKTIQSFTNQLGDDEKMEIEKLISANQQNMKSALQIAQSIENAQINLMKHLFQAFEERIKLIKVEHEATYSYGDFTSLKKYYKTKKKEPVKLTYLVEQTTKGKLYFSIEIDNYLYAGFYMDNGTDAHSLTQQEIKQLLPHIEHYNEEGSFIHWRHLPLVNEDLRPNFAEAGLADNYLRLYDEATFHSFVEACLAGINELYGKPITKEV